MKWAAWFLLFVPAVAVTLASEVTEHAREQLIRKTKRYRAKKPRKARAYHSPKAPIQGLLKPASDRGPGSQ